MSRGARILRFVSAILFIGAGALTYVAFERSPMANMVAILFVAVGLINLLLIFVLGRFFPRFTGDE